MKDVLQAHQEALYLAEIFQSVHHKFLDALDHLSSHPCAVKATDTTVSLPSTGHNQSMRRIFSSLSEEFTSIFGGSSLDGYNKATINKKKKKYAHFARKSKLVKSTDVRWICAH